MTDTVRLRQGAQQSSWEDLHLHTLSNTKVEAMKLLAGIGLGGHPCVCSLTHSSTEVMFSLTFISVTFRLADRDELLASI